MPQPITSSLQNIVYKSLYDLIGTTSTGYGAQLISEAISVSSPVTSNDLNNMILDIERCLIHQNGTSTSSLQYVTSGTLANSGVLQRMYTEVQLLQANQGKVHPSQISTMTVNTVNHSPIAWTCTNYTTTATMKLGQGYATAANWSWFYPKQLQYFFNLGGYIKPQISIENTPASNDIAAWQPLIDSANNVKFGRTEYLQALSGNNSYQVVITGRGNKQSLQRYLSTVHHSYNTSTVIVYENTTTYSANAVIVTFANTGTDIHNMNQIVGSLNFVAGLGTTGTSKTKTSHSVTKQYNSTHHVTGTIVTDIFTRAIIGQYISVGVQLETDFLTVYPTGANGGIAAQIPQTQLISNKVSASPSPVPQFNCGVGESTTSTTVTLRNNSTITCVVDGIDLIGYTNGVVTPTTMTIPSGSSADFTISYNGTAVGHYKGVVHVRHNVNPLYLFTEINVGSTHPTSWIVSTSTIATISKNFVVDHAGGYFKNFGVSFPNVSGFTYVPLVTGTNDTFNITFDPIDLPNGVHVTTATVTVNPLDSSLSATTWPVPVRITTDIENRQIAQWASALFYNNTKLGVSYDIIDGTPYVTIGIGPNNPNMSELAVRALTFSSWQEVYRFAIPTNNKGTLHSKYHVVKQNPAFTYNDHFGVGLAMGSLITLNHDEYANISLYLNPIAIGGANDAQQSVLDGITKSFFYFDPSRTNQLQQANQLVEGGQTYYLKGIDRDGSILTSLVKPNA